MLGTPYKRVIHLSRLFDIPLCTSPSVNYPPGWVSQCLPPGGHCFCQSFGLGREGGGWRGASLLLADVMRLLLAFVLLKE